MDVDCRYCWFHGDVGTAVIVIIGSGSFLSRGSKISKASPARVSFVDEEEARAAVVEEERGGG